MTEIAIQPNMRMIWTAMKLFRVPITHEYIQNLTEFDLQFIDVSTALDNPKFYEKIKNTFYDEEFDEYANEAEEDELTEEEKAIMEQVMNKGSSERNEGVLTEEYDDFLPIQDVVEDPNDWEEVE